MVQNNTVLTVMSMCAVQCFLSAVNNRGAKCNIVIDFQNPVTLVEQALLQQLEPVTCQKFAKATATRSNKIFDWFTSGL